MQGFEVLGVACCYVFEHGLVELGDQLRRARPVDPGCAVRPARVEPVAALQRAGEGFVFGVGVGDGEPAHGAFRLLDHVDEAPVGDGRHGETRRRGEHGPVIRRGREERVGLGQEGEAPLGGGGPGGTFVEKALLVDLRSSALYRRAQHLRHLLQEQDLVLRERPSLSGVRAQYAVGTPTDVDRGAQAAYHPVLLQEIQVLEAVLRWQVLDHHRSRGDEGVTGLGPEVRTHRGRPHESLSPPHAGPQQERGAVGHELQDLAVLDPEHPGDRVHRLVHEPGEVRSGERRQPEPAGGLLLAHPGPQLLFCRPELRFGAAGSGIAHPSPPEVGTCVPRRTSLPYRPRGSQRKCT